MKLLELDVEHYGLFSNQSFSFAGGLHIIHGPNEAGKSTLLQLIREILFGFKTRNPYAFADHDGEMAATATIEMASGQQLTFRRRKGRDREVQGHWLGEQRTLDAAALGRLLGSATSGLYQHVFGFSLRELAEGEQSLKGANLDEALFGGALGGLASFQKALASIKSEHESLFSPTATKREINQLLTTIRKQNRELKEVTIPPPQYKTLNKQVMADREARRELQTERTETRKRLEKWDDLHNALGPWRKLCHAEQELASWQIPSGLGRGAGLQFDGICEQLQAAQQEAETWQNELDESREIRANLQWDERLVTAAGRIKVLQKRLESVRSCRQDIPQVQHQADAIRREIAAQLKDLHPDWDATHLADLKIVLADRERIEQLRKQHQQLQQQKTQQQNDRQRVARELNGLEQQRQALGNVELPAEWLALQQDAAEYRSQQQTCQDARQQRAQTAAAAESLQRELKLGWPDAEEDPCRWAVPSDAQVLEFRKSLADLDTPRRDAQRRLAEARDAVPPLEETLTRLQSKGQVPDHAELMEQRGQRDQHWQAQQATWRDVIEGKRKLPTLPQTRKHADQYEQLVARADATADQRQRSAELVALTEQCQADLQQARRKQQQAEAAFQEAEQNWQREQHRWQQAWMPCSIEPASPEVMQQWLASRQKLVDLRQQVDLFDERIDSCNSAMEQFTARLRMALQAPAGESTGTLLARLEQQISQVRESLGQRKIYDSQWLDKQQQADQLEQQAALWDEQWDDWQEQWKRTLEKHGLPADWDVDATAKTLDAVVTARNANSEAERHEQRVSAMRDTLQRFEVDMQNLANDLQRDLQGQLPEDALEIWSDQLDLDRSSCDRHAELTERLQIQEKRLEAKRKQIQRLAEQRDELLQQAGVPSAEEFHQVAERAQRVHDLQDQVRHARELLQAMAPAGEYQQLVDALAAVDPDELDTQRRETQQQLDALEQQWETLSDEWLRREQQLQEIGHDQRAIACQAELESTRSCLRDAVDRWAPLVIAQNLLREAIDRFQHECQPELLRETGELLSHMTLGRYREIQRKLDEQGTWQIVQQDGSLKEPDQLSTGTREQLYLAIRLAYIRHYCRDAEPLPIVMDDVLVNFDQQRARQTMEVLCEFGSEVQILFLTCHQHLVDLIAPLVSSDQLTVLGPPRPQTTTLQPR